MKNKKIIARLLLKPVLAATGGPCADWKRDVRLFSHGLLKKDAENKIVTHLKECAACRLYFLDCMETKKEFLAAYLQKHPPVADRLSSGKDALVKVYPTSKTRRDIPPAPRNWELEQEDVKKELKNEKE